MKRLSISILVLCLLGAYGPADAQWSQAVLERVTSGPENDHLGHSSLAPDDQGTLHLLYDRWMGGADHDFYYKVKPLAGSWTYNVPIGDSSSNLLSPCLAVHPQSGMAYVVFLQNGSLKLGLGNLEVWAYYDLPTPGAPPLFDPALAVDANGFAHVAFILQTSGVYKIGYGYWEGPGSGQFHFQLIVNSELGPFGSGAAPDICVTSDGGVAISYRGGTYLAYRIDVAENFSLGSTNWEIQTIYQPSYQCYESSIEAAPNDNLFLAYSGDLGWGFPGHIFFTYKPNGAMQWGPSSEVSGSFSGVAPKLALMDNGVAHVLFEERSGNILTGNICYTTNLSGSWQPQYLLQGDKYNPSLVIDDAGNGSTCFEQYVDSSNQDIYYYGYVQGGQTLPDVTLTLTPVHPPIIIPPSGGSFSFVSDLHNNASTPAIVDVWTVAVLPNGSVFGPIINFQNLNLAGNATRSRTFQQFVPPDAPPGNYLYVGRAGDYPMGIAAGDTFSFSKQGDRLAEGWPLRASEWAYCEKPSEHVETAAMAWFDASPNPLNPETVLRYDLTSPAHVKLEIFDTLGRNVATLVNRMQEAGSHYATWAGANDPAGVYFARLKVGDQAPQAIKLALVK